MSTTTRMTKQGIRDLDFGVARPKPAVASPVAQAPAALDVPATPTPADGASSAVADGAKPAVADGGAA